MRGTAMLCRIAVGWLLIGFCSWASAAPRHVTTVEGMSEYVLDNGLRVLLFPDPSRPAITVNMTVFVGSRHEGYGEAGMAHLLEHMMFKGTPAHPNIDKAMTERGAQANGSTWVDRTNYFETLPANDENLEFALRLEADRLVNCPIKPEDLASEMTVVRNEFEMGENDPGTVLYHRMLGVAYEWHNYGRATIGNRSDIERVPAERLREFYRKYYQPDNVLLILAGRFDTTKALALVDKYFGALPRPQRTLQIPYTEEPPQDGERTVTLRRVGDVALVAVMYHVPAGPHEEFPAVHALAEILGDTPTGRLHKVLVESKKAAAVFGAAPALHDPGYLYLGASVRGEQSIEEVRAILLQTIDQVLRDGVTPEEVARVKTRFAAQWRRALANTSQLAVRLSEWAAQGDWRLFFLMRDRMEQLSAEAVHQAARKYLRPSNRTVGLYLPTKEPDRTPVPPRPDVGALLKDYRGRQAPAPGESLDPDPMKLEARIQRHELPFGPKVAMLPKKTRQEMVYVRLSLYYGTAENLKGQAAAADMLPQLMVRGTRRLTRQQLKDALEQLEATLGAFGSAGAVTLALQMPNKSLFQALEMLREVIREPALAESEFEILRREKLAALEEDRHEPQFVARRALLRALNPYPKDDIRYVPTAEEEMEQLRALTLDQVRSLYTKYLGGQAAEFVVIGQFEPAATLPRITAMLEGWKAEMPQARIGSRAPEGVPGSLQTIRTPDKANAVYEAGLAIPMDDHHPDYPALFMAARVFGGSWSGRLFQRVREKEGLSYSVGASFRAEPLDADARFLIHAICNPANIDKARQIIAEELHNLRTHGVQTDELAREKKGYLQQAAMLRSQDAALASILASQVHYGRTMNDVAEREKKILELTPEQVWRAAQKYLDPAKLVIVTAGDFPVSGEAKPATGQ